MNSPRGKKFIRDTISLFARARFYRAPNWGKSSATFRRQACLLSSFRALSGTVIPSEAKDLVIENRSGSGDSSLRSQ
jgi:hypothetical protein